MTTNTRIYLVYNDDHTYLIRATSKAQAVGHVARNLLACRVASQNDLVALVADGTRVIDAGTDAEVSRDGT